jgi:hypothetical protein
MLQHQIMHHAALETVPDIRSTLSLAQAPF